MKFPQSIQIPGKPKVLALNAAGNVNGWENEMAARVCNVMRRQQVEVVGPVLIEDVTKLNESVTKSDANCLFVMATAKKLSELLNTIGKGYKDKSKVLAVYLTDQVSAELGKTPFTIATLISTPSLTQKEAALFYPEFFSELSNHSEDGIGMPMVRFCHAKANRFAPGKVEIRAE